MLVSPCLRRFASLPGNPIGHHSMASQAATGGQPIRAIQAQLAHRSAQSTEVYAHLGSSAQPRLVRALEPASPPHRGQYLVNESRIRKPRNA